MEWSPQIHSLAISYLHRPDEQGTGATTLLELSKNLGLQDYDAHFPESMTRTH